MIYGSSLIQSALPFSKTGFFNDFPIVLITHSPSEEHLSVFLEESCMFLLFRKF